MSKTLLAYTFFLLSMMQCNEYLNNTFIIQILPPGAINLVPEQPCPLLFKSYLYYTVLLVNLKKTYFKMCTMFSFTTTSLSSIFIHTMLLHSVSCPVPVHTHEFMENNLLNVLTIPHSSKAPTPPVETLWKMLSDQLSTPDGLCLGFFRVRFVLSMACQIQYQRSRVVHMKTVKNKEKHREMESLKQGHKMHAQRLSGAAFTKTPARNWRLAMKRSSRSSWRVPGLLMFRTDSTNDQQPAYTCCIYCLVEFTPKCVCVHVQTVFWETDALGCL